MKNTLIATATYNEAENIKELIIKIKKTNKSLDILIVDDNSPDGTAKIINHLKNRNKNINLFLIKRKKKEGLDTAHKNIYEYAKRKRYKYLITMDADLSHDPKVIPKFLKYIKKYDCVIGSRYINGGENKLKGIRLFISKFGNIFIKRILNYELSEFTTSYRCFNLRKLKDFNLKEINFKGYSFFMGSIILIYRKGYSIKEIPIKFNERKKGKSKIPRIELIRTLINLFKIKFGLI